MSPANRLAISHQLKEFERSYKGTQIPVINVCDDHEKTHYKHRLVYQTMNVVFMGTPEFAVPSLRSLATSTHKIIAVVTQPDRPKGRSKIPSPSPVKEAVRELGLQIMQPVNINEETVVKQLQYLSPDCIVVVAFGQFLSIPIINLPGYRCINIHASLLPKLRGAAPINWAIIQGERTTGVTAVVMTAKMDAGDIIAQKRRLYFPGKMQENLKKGWLLWVRNC